MIDLHLHSTASDGTLTPQELVQLASKLNYHAIAVTDHDSVGGVEPALRAGRKQAKIEVIPAVELSSDLNGRDVHFLGYFIDYKDSELAKHLRALREARHLRAAKMVEKLREAGFDILLKDVLEVAGKGAIGRAHVARVMVKKGQIDSVKEVFNKFIGRHAPCYVKKFVYTPKDVIKIIKKIGGIAVLAHPSLSEVDEHISKFKEYGLQGLEAIHSEHTKEQIEYYQRLAKRLGLVVTGGSDCHGLESTRGLIMGSVNVPDKALDDLKQLRATENV